MLWYPKIKCPRGLESCRSYGQVVTDDDNPMSSSFFCCGKNNGTMPGQLPEDVFTLCFHGEFRNTISYNDRRDLIDQMHVIASALSHIEIDRLTDCGECRKAN